MPELTLTLYMLNNSVKLAKPRTRRQEVCRIVLYWANQKIEAYQHPGLRPESFPSFLLIKPGLTSIQRRAVLREYAVILKVRFLLFNIRYDPHMR